MAHDIRYMVGRLDVNRDELLVLQEALRNLKQATPPGEKHSRIEWLYNSTVLILERLQRRAEKSSR